MTKWIRWQGVAAFFLISVALVAVLYIFSGPLIRATVENGGRYFSGKHVELKGAVLSFDPIGVQLDSLTVHDTDDKSILLASLGQAGAKVDLDQLLLGHIVIDDLGVRDLYINPHAARAIREDSSDSGLEELLKGALPDLDQLIEQTGLSTVKRGMALEAAYEEYKSRLETTLRALPDEEKLNEYEQRIQTITSGDMSGPADIRARKRELDALKDQVKKDKANIDELRGLIKEAKTDLTEKLSALRKAPERDLANIKEGIPYLGEIEQASRFIFSGKIQQYWRQGMAYYQQYKPLLAGDPEPERAAGRLVSFPTESAIPQFLIRNADVSLRLPIGNLTGRLTNITHQHDILGAASEFELQAMDLEYVDRFDIRGRAGRFSEGVLASTEYRIEGLRLEDNALLENDALTLLLQKAFVNLQGNAEYDADEMIADLDLELWGTDFAGNAGNEFAQILLDAFNGIDQFSLELAARGAPNDPDLSFSSSLDSMLRDAFSGILEAQTARLTRAIRERLNQELRGFTDTDYMASFNNAEQRAQVTDQKLQELLESQVSQAVDKENIMDKVKGFFKDRF